MFNYGNSEEEENPGGVPLVAGNEDEQRRLNAHRIPISAEELAAMKAESDAMSVYVANVDYQATSADLEQHFRECGSVARITILCDKYYGNPKGFAYVEFMDKEGWQNALGMTGSLLRGRAIRVEPKRTNRPGISTTNRPPPAGRGRGGRGRGYWQGQ